MADVFISYDREDRERVRPLAEALGGAGFSVWWDRNIIAGKQFDRVIEQALDEAKCVMVCWSRHSTDSEWVKNEAAAGAERGILVPAFLDDVRLPLEFRRRQTVSLIDWNGTPTDPGFVELCEGIRAAIHGHPPGESGPRPQDPVRLPQRKSLIWITAALLLIALAGSGVYLAYRARSPDVVDPFIRYPRTAQILSGSTVISRGVFTPKGYVLAMSHSVPDPSKLSVGWEESGKIKRTTAKVVKRGLVADEVVLLQLEDPPDRSLPFPTRIAATLQPNESVERYLAPNDRAPGKVKKLFAEMEVHTGTRPVRLKRLLVTTMISGPGDSGAPVVDAKGQVVGLVYGASQSETISLMIEDITISFPEAF